MNYETAHETLEQRLETFWSTTPVVWENVQHESLSEGGDPFVAMRIYWGTDRQAAFGNKRLFRVNGVLSLEFHVRELTGMRLQAQFLDAIKPAFRGQQFSGITTWRVRVLGSVMREGWTITTVQVDFYFDEEQE